jgi:hypothetical protein
MNDVQIDLRADALDALIGEERTLIDRYDARKGSADTVTAAAVTGVLALAALAATAAQTIKTIDKTFAWIVAGVLAAVCLVALCERFLAGLRPDASGLTSRSPAYRSALAELRNCGPANNLDPILVRQRILAVCRALATDAESAAESKERWAAFASFGLALAVLLTGILGLSLS